MQLCVCLRITVMSSGFCIWRGSRTLMWHTLTRHTNISTIRPIWQTDACGYVGCMSLLLAIHRDNGTCAHVLYVPHYCQLPIRSNAHTVGISAVCGGLWGLYSSSKIHKWLQNIGCDALASLHFDECMRSPSHKRWKYGEWVFHKVAVCQKLINCWNLVAMALMGDIPLLQHISQTQSVSSPGRDANQASIQHTCRVFTLVNIWLKNIIHLHLGVVSISCVMSKKWTFD